MNSIPIMGIPIVNRPDLLMRLVKSVDYPIDILYVIDNSNEEYGTAEGIKAIQGVNSLIKQIRVHTSTESPNGNMGVAASWNFIMKTFPDAPYWFIVGNDIQFGPGDLEKMNEHAIEHPEVCNIYGNHGHSFFIVTKLSLEIVGTFDENIYPAYLEDCDYSRRMHLLGALAFDVQGITAVHGEAPSWGSMTIHSDERLRALNGNSHQNNHGYYLFKWGNTKPGEEQLTHPYGDEDMSPKDWIPIPEFRKRNEALYR